MLARNAGTNWPRTLLIRKEISQRVKTEKTPGEAGPNHSDLAQRSAAATAVPGPGTALGVFRTPATVGGAARSDR
jgi:hypothetical protein